MRKILLFLMLSCSIQLAMTQEVCTSKNNELADINSVDKCLVKKTNDNLNEAKESSIITVATISSRRYLKRRVYFERVVSLATGLKAQDISRLKVVNDLKSCYLSNLSPIVIKTEPKLIENGVPFDVVDEIPLFSSCASASINKEDCFNYEMKKHIVNTFTYPEKALEKGIEGNVRVSFIIDATGKVTSIKTEGEGVHEILKQEAERIVSLLPNFIPGKQEGKATNVLYSFPMDFTLNTITE
ncbi:energy transducer TonB [Tenacibaculum sp.]|uniref:energy transducer TonB n=1 Tax=Tenacibaculum sp. TaxID=1906242 RepID=UPI003D143264